jgi:hypothetical protein
MVLLIIGGFNQIVTLDIPETTTVRQCIFQIGKSFEEKGVVIEDIINYGLYHETSR